MEQGPRTPSADASSDDEKPDLASTIGLRIGQGFAIVAMVALPVLVALVAYRAYTAGEIDPSLNPVNSILASRIVVGMIRIAIIVAVMFLIVSLIAAAVRGQFLLQIGPVRLSHSVRGVAADRDRLAADLAQAGQTIADLEQRLQDTARQLEATGADLDLALDYIRTMEGPPEERESD
jgi:hypothetical protein